MLLTIGPMIALSQVIAYYRTDVVDDQMFGYYGWRITQGATVYLDVWDNKPPGIYWANAIGMLIGGGSYLGVIAMCVLALVVSHVAFFVIGTSLFHRGAAALATILLSFYLTHAWYTGGTNRTETFLVACELTAVAFYMRGWAKDRWWTWFTAGLFAGGAFLFKQVGLAAWGALGLHTIIVVLTRRLTWPVGLRRCLLLLGGAGTAVSLAVAYLTARGALGDAIFATFTFNRTYAAIGDVQFPYNYANVLLMWEHFQLALILPLLMAVAGGLHALLWYFRPEHRPPEIEEPLKAQQPVCPLHFLLFAIWFGVAFYGALLSPSRFRHYLVACIPPLLLMAGHLLNVLRAEARILKRIQQRAWVAAAFVVMAYFSWEALHTQFQEVSKVIVSRIDRQEAASWELIGDAVARHTDPDDRIQCWGYMPGVYLRARRPNATRFTTLEKVGQVREGANFVVQEVERELRADPPAVIAISARYYLWMQGLDRQDRPSEFQLGPWLDEHYQLVEEVARESVYIFKRRDQIDPARDPNLDAYLHALREQLRSRS